MKFIHQLTISYRQFLNFGTAKLVLIYQISQKFCLQWRNFTTFFINWSVSFPKSKKAYLSIEILSKIFILESFKLFKSLIWKKSLSGYHITKRSKEWAQRTKKNKMRFPTKYFSKFSLFIDNFQAIQENFHAF